MQLDCLDDSLRSIFTSFIERIHQAAPFQLHTLGYEWLEHITSFPLQLAARNITVVVLEGSRAVDVDFLRSIAVEYRG